MRETKLISNIRNDVHKMICGEFKQTKKAGKNPNYKHNTHRKIY